MAEYILTLNSDQAQEALKAIELLMRLRLGQYDQIPFAVLDISDDGFCNKRDRAEPLLQFAFDAMSPEGHPSNHWYAKDDEWYRLYNLYQVIRYAIHQAEHPDSAGVDSYPPIQMTNEPMPVCEWRLEP